MQERFEEALRRHRQGELAGAEEMYRALLRDTPDAPDVLNALGVLCQQQGKNAEAIRWFREALAQDPDAADTHFNLGAVLHQQGKLVEAVESYRQAIAGAPEQADVQYNLGNALMALNRFEEAVSAYRAFLDHRPASAAGHYNLGLALAKAHRFEEAITAYRAAIAERPDFAEALANLGAVLMEMDRTEEALAVYRQAQERHPDLAEAHYNLGNALMGLGRFEEAEARFRDAIARWPDFAALHLRLAQLKTFSANDPDVAAMEATFRTPNLGEAQKTAFCFALGKAYEDCVDYDRAFDYFEQGNALKRATLAFDPDEEEVRANRIIATFNKTLLTEKEGWGIASDAPIFLVGMPRSGAALIEQILATHSGVFGGGERSALADCIDAAAKAAGSAFPEAAAAMTDEDAARLGTAYLEAMRRLAPSAAHFTDRGAMHVRYVGLLHLVFPNAKIVHVTRNPFDSCLSSYQCLFDNTRYPFAYDLTELGKAYKQYERLMNHWHALLPGRLLDLAYEELVADPQTQIRRLLDFCALPWDAACLDFHRTERLVPIASALRLRQPMAADAVRRWRKYEHRLTPLLEALA